MTKAKDSQWVGLFFYGGNELNSSMACPIHQT